MKTKLFYNYKDVFLFRFPFTNTYFRYKKWWHISEKENK